MQFILTCQQAGIVNQVVLAYNPLEQAQLSFEMRQLSGTNEMEFSNKFLHDRSILILITVVSVLVVIGISLVLLTFDVSKNPTTIVAYRQNITGSSYQSGKPIDIYSLAIFMFLTAIGAVLLSAKLYLIRRSVSLFILGSGAFLLALTIIVSRALISLQ